MSNIGSSELEYQHVQYTVISDSEDSTVTYTVVSSLFGGLSDIRSLGFIGPEHEGLPWILDDPYVQVALQAPPSPDYIPGLEEPQSLPPLEDEILPAKEQPLPAADSPTTNSPGYILESDLEEDDDKDPEEDPVDYPANGGDDGAHKDEPSDDDEDEEVDIEADDEEEEEHPAPANSTAVALPAIDQAPSAKETEPFKTETRVPTPVWSDAEVARLLAISTPPSSPISPWSSPLPQIPFPPLPLIPSPSLPLSPPLLVSAPSPASPIRLLGYRAAMIWLRAEAASTSHSLPLPPLSPIPVPTSSPPLLLHPSTNSLRKGTDLRPTEVLGTPVVTDVAEFSQRMTEFETRVRQDTDEIYTRGYVVTYSGGSTTSSDYRATSNRPQEVGGDYKDASGRSQEAEAVHRGTEAVEETSNSNDRVQETAGTRQSTYRSTNGEDIHNSRTGVRRNEQATHECTYPDFMKCQPLNFKGTEGVVELTQWVKKMETVFHISNCSVENQINFSTCTLLGNALTWWNSHIRTVGNDIAYAMTWTELKKKMTNKYSLRTEIKKLEVELWNLKVKGIDVIGYNQCFQELALLCVRMFPEESDKIK
ncbi:reverse transcriptase domain-containing protein, partial [Tanacetum coccineum]